MGKSDTKDEGKVYIQLSTFGGKETLTFRDGDTVEHLIKAVSASGGDLEMRISGKDLSEIDKGKTVGDLARESGKGSAREPIQARASSRRGSHG